MMSSQFSLLREALTGDKIARDKFLATLATETLSTEEYEQIHLFLKQASREQPSAIYLRGLLYDKGYGVNADPDMAFLLMREAAAKGNSLAIYEVGHRFLMGVGVPTNYISARQWLVTAAESPHYIKEAMIDLATIYEQGLGVEVDYEQAKDWQERSQH